MNTPSHDDVAQCARELWQSYGRPEGRDQEIWLEAERKLASQVQPADGAKSNGAIDPERLKTEMAAESVEEFNLDSGTSDQAAIKAALQTNQGSGAQTPRTAAPKAAEPKLPATKAPVSGKAAPTKARKG